MAHSAVATLAASISSKIDASTKSWDWLKLLRKSDECPKSYLKLAEIFASDFRYARALTQVIESAECDSFSRALVHVCAAKKSCVLLIESLVQAEFESNSNPETILRMNSVASKVMGVYVRLLGQPYLVETIGLLIQDIVSNADLSFEIDPSKLKNPVVEIERNSAALIRYATLVLDRLCDPANIDLMPRPIRASAGCIAQCVEAFSLPQDFDFILIGGFIMLRFVNPALATPETFGLLPEDQRPSGKSRRNLVLLTKVLQNLSNGVVFGQKEPYMSVLNNFVGENMARMQIFLRSVATDPAGGAGLGEGEVPPAPWASERSVDSEIDVKKIEPKDLLRLHWLLHQFSEKLVPILQRESTKDGIIGEELVGKDVEFVNLLQELGSPPVTNNAHTAVASKDEIAQRIETVVKITFQNYSENVGMVDTSNLEKIDWIYIGPESRDGGAVIYLIFNRISENFLSDINTCVVFFLKKCGEIIENKYSVVLDMSWCSPSAKMKKTLADNAHELLRVFSRRQRKNLSKVYILHPHAFFISVVSLVESLASKKVSKKIRKIYRWKNLIDFIEPKNLLLPQETIDFNGKMFVAMKINSRGRQQLRYIKLTLDSILNIVPSQKSARPSAVKNEILFSQILEINGTSGADGYGFKIRHLPSAGSTPGYFIKETRKMKMRTYICRSVEERDEILSEIFPLKIRAKSQPFATFIVKKIGTLLQPERWIKLTPESLVIISGKIYKREIVFSSVEKVSVVPAAQGPLALLSSSPAPGVAIKIIHESKCIVFETWRAEELVEAVEVLRANANILQDMAVEDSVSPDYISIARLSAIV